MSSSPFAFLGNELVGQNGATVPVTDLENSPAVAVYFSAHWCPPCRGFTPVLSEFYEEVNDGEKQLEIVFVSLDQDETSFKSYFGTMPWLAAKFDKALVTKIQEKIPFQGIPYLVVLNKDGSIKSTTGRADVTSQGPGCIGSWKN